MVVMSQVIYEAVFDVSILFATLSILDMLVWVFTRGKVVEADFNRCGLVRITIVIKCSFTLVLFIYLFIYSFFGGGEWRGCGLFCLFFVSLSVIISVGPAGRLIVQRGKNFNVAILSDTISVMDVNLCLMVLLFILLSVIMIRFQRNGGVKQFVLIKKKKKNVVMFSSD